MSGDDAHIYAKRKGLQFFYIVSQNERFHPLMKSRHGECKL